jgi:hypothetical protein
VLSLKSNRLCADGGKALAKGLKGNTVITELDISSNDLGENSDYEPDMSGVIALADAIPDMGALSLLNLTDNNIGEERVQKMKEMCVSRNISLLIN